MKNTFIFNFKRDLAFSFVEKRSGTFLNQILDHIWTLFLLFCIYIKVNRKLKMPLTGFELWISGVWNNHSTNCAPQPLPKTRYLLLMSSCIPQSWYKTFMCFKCFLNDSIWFIRFDTIICVSNLLCELWNRKLNMKEIYFFKKVWLVWVNEICWYIKIIFLADSYPVKHGVSHTVPPNVSEYSLVELINRVGHWLWLSW